MDRRALEIRESTQAILRSFSVEKQEFGLHWEEIKRSRYDGTLTDDGLEKLCKFLFVATTKCGLTADSIPRHYMIKPLEWRFKSVGKKTVKLCDKVRRHMAKQQKVTEFYPGPDQDEGHDGANRSQDPEGEEPARAPIDPWSPPKIAIGKDALDGYNAVSYQSWLGPEDMRLREEPSKNQQQVLLDFGVGKKLFPLDLLEASAENRYNWHETVVCFDKAASEAQVPVSIPEPFRTPCLDAVRSCNPRLKPSQQECYENIERCIRQKIPIHLADLIAMLCFVHFQVGETGRNKWLWKKLKAAHILKCCQYDFNWGNIENGIIYDRKGRSLAKKITTEGPQPRGRRVSRTQIGAKRDRAKFQRRILHVYQGTNEDGVAVYKTYHDKFLANEAALDKLHQDQLMIGTELDEEERMARTREGQRHPVPHHYMDENNEEVVEDI